MTKNFLKIAMYKYESVNGSHHIVSTDWGQTWEVHKTNSIYWEASPAILTGSRLGIFRQLRTAKRFILKHQKEYQGTT